MDRIAILEDYRQLRATGLKLNLALHQMLGRVDVQTAARRLGMMSGDTLVLETEDEIAVVLDFAFHNVWHNGNTVIDRKLLENPPAPGSTEDRLLRALQQSFHTLIEVQRTIPGFGIECVEGPNRRPITVVDINFSRSAIPGLAILARLSSPGEGWYMTTGSGLPVNSEAAEKITAAMQRFLLQHRRQPDDCERETMMIRACLKAGSAEQIRYASPDGDDEVDDAPRQLAPVRRHTPKVGRNEPCPCGTGRKYKACCQNRSVPPPTTTSLC
jgi:hypothetical protein